MPGDWTDKCPAIAKAIADLPVQNAYLDGELYGAMPGWDSGASYVFGDTHRDSARARLHEMLDTKAGVEGERKS